MKKYHLPLLICLFLGCFFNVHAQQSGQFIEESQLLTIPFTITTYSTKHGLPQNQVISILPKKDGELIINTANGIVSYSGSSFQNFITNSAYKSNTYLNLYYLEKSHSLFGTRYDGTLDAISPHYQPTFKFAAACIFQDKLYYLLTDGTLYSRNSTFLPATKRIQTGIKNAQCLYLSNQFIYVGSSKGLFRIDRKTNRTDRISNEQIVGFRWNKFTKTLYAFTFETIFKIDQNKLTAIEIATPKHPFWIRDLAFTPANEIYVATSNGLLYTGPYYSEIYNKSTYLPAENLYSVYYSDIEDCLFVGTNHKGLLKLHIKNCTNMMHDMAVSNAAFSSIVNSKKWGIIATASDNTIYRLTLFGSDTLMKFNGPTASLAEINGQLYVGTWGDGVHIMNGKTEIGAVKFPQLPDNIVHGSYKDKQGFIWIATSKGIARGKTWKTIRPFLSKQIKKRVICFYPLKNGNLCIGGTEGVFIIDPKGTIVQHWGKKEKLRCKEVRSFYEDPAGKLWIGTYDGGLYCLEKNQLTSINSLPNCGLNHDVFTLAKDSKGNIYMTSNVGLWVIQEQKLNAFYQRKINYLIPFYYGNESGILNTEFNGGFQNNFAKSKHDHFYFPSIEGIVVVNPDDYTFRKRYTHLTSLLADGKQISIDQLIFKRETTSLEFYFNSANFISKFNVFYQYRLKGPGLDNQWSPLQKSGRIRLFFLHPGDYVIQMRALDGYNDSNPTIVSKHFTISPYYYETLWFQLLMIFVAIVTLTFFIRFRIQQARKNELQANAIQNTVLELKLKAIQAKMNPHFIFNSLNNIQYLIVLNKKDEAEKALNEFSLLLRKFLQQSDQSFTRVQEEINILKLYVSIEQFRFDHELEVDFNVPENCNQLILPTLIVQPVVENALKHGLSHNQGLRKLTVTVGRDVIGNLTIEITDNGIGRAASQKLNAYRENHISHGWNLIQQKIQMIQDKYQVKISYAITDIISPETGTKVSFYIPVIPDELLEK
jgi:ligand-binding sensor domain-containing protein/two-component sensor histidine kinase